MRHIFIFFVQCYAKALSPLLGCNCRFYPTCSRYMMDSLKKYGSIKGLWLGVKRLCKCHPWGKPPFDDPVP